MGQLIMYHNIGLDLKNPKPGSENGVKSYKDMSPTELLEARAEAKRILQEDEVVKSNGNKAQYREKYGDV